MPITHSPQLKARFDERKRDTMRALADFAPGDCLDDSRFFDLLHHLHKLAGVAGLFGARQLGELIALAETELRAASPAERAPRLAALKLALEAGVDA